MRTPESTTRMVALAAAAPPPTSIVIEMIVQLPRITMLVAQVMPLWTKSKSEVPKATSKRQFLVQ